MLKQCSKVISRVGILRKTILHREAAFTVVGNLRGRNDARQCSETLDQHYLERLRGRSTSAKKNNLRGQLFNKSEIKTIWSVPLEKKASSRGRRICEVVIWCKTARCDFNLSATMYRATTTTSRYARRTPKKHEMKQTDETRKRWF